jgi:hypothetical protein
VAHLGYRHADPHALGFWQHPLRNGTLLVESPVANNVTSWPAASKPCRQLVDDELDTAVERRRYRRPRRRDYRDPHFRFNHPGPLGSCLFVPP